MITPQCNLHDRAPSRSQWSSPSLHFFSYWSCCTSQASSTVIDVSQLALIAHFSGDPTDLEDRLRSALTRYARDLDAPQPSSAVLMRNKEGIAVVLIWPEGSGIKPFQSFLRGTLAPLGLPHPRVEHFRADTTFWNVPTRE